MSMASSPWAGVAEALGVETSAGALDFRFGGIVSAMSYRRLLCGLRKDVG